MGEKNIPTPETVLGYQVGTARRLPDWREMLEFFSQLSAVSDRVEVEHLGESTDGLPYIAVFVSSPTNLARRQHLREMLGKLHDPRNLSLDDAEAIVDGARVTAFLLCTQHSNEIGAALMTMELASDLAHGDDDETSEILDNVVTVMIPTHNPDGHQMIVEWYRKWLDTPYEGQPMPWLYHRYVGHDNNRDWFMLTQKETRIYAALHNREHPQLVFDMHQMGRDGARFMVPPFIDPLDPNQDPVIQQGFAELGSAIAARLTAAGKSGVATNIIFDNYSPSLAYGNYHGSVDLLSEAASVLLATPVTVEEDRLKAERGFDPRKRTWNHPMPWKGGEWTLRDIVEYDKIAARTFLEHAARNRRQWLTNYLGIMQRTVERQNGPVAFLIPEQQDDPGTTHELLETLALGAVEIGVATDAFVADGVTYPAGTRVILLAQPAGNFAKTILEVQEYPDLRRWPDGPPAAPYDIAGHTLPLQMGVRCIEVRQPFETNTTPFSHTRPTGVATGNGSHGWYVSPRTNRSILAVNRLLAAGVDVLRLAGDVRSERDDVLLAGGYVIQAGEDARTLLETIAEETGVDVVGVDAPLEVSLLPISQPRVGVYQSWRPTIDEGWVRWIFEEYEQPYTTLHDADIRQGNLRRRFDTIVIPQQKPEDILKGNPEKNDYKEPYPPEYVGGLGDLGADALRTFVEQGGTLVALDSACDFAIEHLYLPVRNVVAGMKEEEFYCPGSLVRLVFDDPCHPVAFGMRRHEVGLFMKSPVFDLLPPGGDSTGTRGRVVASYPLHAQNLSGWILGSEHLAGKAAIVDVPMGRGRVVLIGFRPQFRAQARGTYRVLFNAIRYVST